MSAAISAEELATRLGALPRIQLARLPTPLQHCPRLSTELGGPQVYVKRDDLTDVGLGGNKARHLEFTLGEVVGQGVDVVIQTGTSTQSNACRQLAAAAAMLGIECHLVLGSGGGTALQGNLLLDHLFGAHVHVVDTDVHAELYPLAEEIERRAREAGKRVYRIIPQGNSQVVAGPSYVNALLEMMHQSHDMKIEPRVVCVTTGNGGTHAAIALAVKAMALPYRVVGITNGKTSDVLAPIVCEIAAGVAQRLQLDVALEPGEIEIWDDYIGPGYGIPSPEGNEALRQVARLEGLLLDPEYTAKAMAGLMALIRKGEIEEGPVIFLHTGGHPLVFAHGSVLVDSTL